MNCKTCTENFEKCQEGRLPEDMKIQIEEHLKICPDCNMVYSTLQMTESFIKEEKQIEANPFLSTRIMAKIETMQQKQEVVESVPIFTGILKPVLITFSIAFAVFIGILAGNFYQPIEGNNSIPEELVYMSDANIEQLAFFMND